jgi:hypothetical protein
MYAYVYVYIHIHTNLSYPYPRSLSRVNTTQAGGHVAVEKIKGKIKYVDISWGAALIHRNVAPSRISFTGEPYPGAVMGYISANLNMIDTDKDCS